jgi:transposase-like protein
MTYCPEDGKEMVCTNSAISFADYECPECHTHWQYDAEEGCYRVIMPEEQN